MRSLTLLETPVYQVAPDDPGVAHVRALGDAVMRDGLDTEPAALREFLRLAGATGLDDGSLPEPVARGVRRAHGGRPPGTATLDLAALRAAGVPALVASGDHVPALERLADGLRRELAAERVVSPGAGHFVAAAPGFADRLSRFLTTAA